MALHANPSPLALALAFALLAAAGCGDGDSSDADAGRTDAADVGASDAEPDGDDDSAQSDADRGDAGDGSPPDADQPDARPDSGDDAGDGSECPPLTALIERTALGPGGGTDGLDPAEPPPASQSRAGRVQDDGSGTFVFEGDDAACRPGDFVLRNAHVRACIASERAITEFLFDGGHLSDLEPADDPGHDELFFSIAGSGFLVAGSDNVMLVSDGSDGGSAVVRTSGPDVLSHFLAGTVGDLVPSQFVDYETEYRLAPDATALEVVTWVSASDGERRALSVGDLTAPGDAGVGWYGQHGFVAPGTPLPTDVFVALTPERSYGIWGADLHTAAVTLPVVQIPLSSAVFTRGLLCAGDEAAYRRWIAVGNGDTPSVRAALAIWMPERETAPASFVIDRSPAWPNPRFEVVDGEGRSIDVIRLVEGRTDVALPAGSYDAVPVDWPAPSPPTTAFGVPADTPVELPSPALATLDVRVELPTHDAEELSPAKVHVSGPVVAQQDIVDGEGRFFLPLGEYTVSASRGEEYTALSETVTLDSLDTPVRVAFMLEPTLDTRGWVSGDLHLHSVPSLDSTVPLTDRVASCLAAGLDFIGPSDHGALGDFAGAIEALGVQDRIHLLLGEEVSPGRGHLSIFPRTWDPFSPAGGGLALGARRRNSRELFFPTLGEYVTEARRQGTDIVQINHPRGSLAVFTRVGYDPIAGPDAVDSPDWFEDFDSVEIYNTEFRSRFCDNVRDWFSLLSRGWRITGVGNSDTHDLDSAAGFPRTYVASPTDFPASITDRDLVEGLLAQRVTVSGGIFIDFPDGELPGDTLAVAPGETLPLRVRIQTPPWVGVDELRVFVNGAEVERHDLLTDPEEIVDFDDVVEITVDRDAYVVLLAWSATPMSHFSPGRRPFGVTNPIFLDVDGDGWTAPGVGGAEDLPEIEGIAICR